MRLFAFLLAAVLVLPVSYAQYYTPDVISKYYITLTLDSTHSGHVKREITVKNLEDETLLLGSSYIRTSNTVEDLLGVRAKPLNITNLRAFDEHGVPIKASVSKEGADTLITYEAWNPIGPYGNLTIYIEYDVEGELLGGIMFKNFIYPIEKASLAISNVKLTATFPKALRVSYSNGILVDSRTVEWTYPDLREPVTAEAEATYLPFPMMPYRMVFVFWAGMFGILLIIRSYVSRREKGHY